ncbi:MAG: hypothetical protein MUF63_00540 [Rhodobacteraceae bacterium]|nr:hypothetical protein [Paracoccaceae bacterium]
MSAARLDAFGLSAIVEGGALRRLTFAGREVVRVIDYPIRDADWGTLTTVTEGEEGSDAAYSRVFRTADGAMEGRFTARLEGDGASAALVAELLLTARRETVVNRAGFIVLHPLAGVAGEPVTVRHPDGREEAARFPARISPAQPVKDISGLVHRVGNVELAIAFEGEVFEMEDQRNWTDASYKTYCRPLALPRPYRLAAGEQVRQRIVVTVRRVDAAVAAGTGAGAGAARMPEVWLAHEATLGAAHPELATVAPQGVLVRADGPVGAVPAFPLTLEVVTGADAAADLRAAKAAVPGASRVIALPRGYLRSHQPEGPWPAGAGPMDLVPIVREVFPGAEVGGGMLTNFTEFNRCPPDAERVDFCTFGTTAIVHAADDMSVVETLEAIPDVIASARALAGDRPLRLGLMAVGMRSNPYGAAVVANPEGRRLPMAMDDPRQRTAFAAAFAVGVAAACARGGVASFAPAMTGGPLGMADADGVWAVWHAVAALAALAGAEVTVEGGPEGLVVIRGAGRRGVVGVAANLGPGEARVEGAVRIPERSSPGWLDAAGPGGVVTLPPMTAAVLRAGA